MQLLSNFVCKWFTVLIENCAKREHFSPIQRNTTLKDSLKYIYTYKQIWACFISHLPNTFILTEITISEDNNERWNILISCIYIKK